MAAVSKDVLVQVARERLFDVIVDYGSYPEFVPTVKSCRVRREAGGAEADFELDLAIKTVGYTLKLIEERPAKVVWSLVKSDWLQLSNGSWELREEGSATRATYSVEIQVRKMPFVPQMLVDRVTEELTRVQLPRMLDAFKRRAERR